MSAEGGFFADECLFQHHQRFLRHAAPMARGGLFQLPMKLRREVFNHQGSHNFILAKCYLFASKRAALLSTPGGQFVISVSTWQSKVEMSGFDEAGRGCIRILALLACSKVDLESVR
jgi:hypothetical protein